MKNAKRTRRIFDPREKVMAVLAVWTEQQTPTQVCHQLSVSWALLNQWQDQAMEGMVTALSPQQAERQAALNNRLARLVEKKFTGATGKLQARLKKIQDGQIKATP